VTYTRENDNVTLNMTVDDFELLLLMLGVAVGAASKNESLYFRFLKFVNGLNSTNPDFAPYKIPPEFDGPTPRPQKAE
jgi:hypothetical protein